MMIQAFNSFHGEFLWDFVGFDVCNPKLMNRDGWIAEWSKLLQTLCNDVPLDLAKIRGMLQAGIQGLLPAPPPPTVTSPPPPAGDGAGASAGSSHCAAPASAQPTRDGSAMMFPLDELLTYAAEAPDSSSPDAVKHRELIQTALTFGQIYSLKSEYVSSVFLRCVCRSVEAALFQSAFMRDDVSMDGITILMDRIP